MSLEGMFKASLEGVSKIHPWGSVQCVPGGSVQYVPGGSVQYVPGGSVQYVPGGSVQYVPGGSVQYVPGGMFNISQVSVSQEECSRRPWSAFSSFLGIKVPMSEGPSRSLSQDEISTSICLSQSDSYVPTSLITRGLQGDVVYLILADQWRPSDMSPNAGGGGANHVTWSAEKLWRSNSIFIVFWRHIFLRNVSHVINTPRRRYIRG
jgi:hypothetical protein